MIIAPIRRRWRFRFSLRALLFVVTVNCIWLAYEVHQAHEQARAVYAVRRLNGDVNYKYSFLGPHGSSLQMLLGDDLLAEVATVSFSDEYFAADDRLDAVSHLKSLERLSLCGADMTEGALARIAGLHHLRQLCLGGRNVGDADLVGLAELKQLEELTLAETGVTDAGLQNLSGLFRLRLLNLCGTRVTAHGLSTLRDLPRLEQLYVDNDGLSHEDVEEARRAMPNCEIFAYQHNAITGLRSLVTD